MPSKQRKIRKSQGIPFPRSDPMQTRTKSKSNGSWLVVKATSRANRPIPTTKREDRVTVARNERKERFILEKGKFRALPFTTFPSLSSSVSLSATVSLSLPLLPIFLRYSSLPYYHWPRTTCIINGGLRVQWDEKQPWVILPRKILLALTYTGKRSVRSPPLFSYLLASSCSPAPVCPSTFRGL